MDESDRRLRGLQRLSGRLRAAEARTAELREQLHAEIVAARKAGATITAIGQATGVTRQRIQQILGGR